MGAAKIAPHRNKVQRLLKSASVLFGFLRLNKTFSEGTVLKVLLSRFWNFFFSFGGVSKPSLHEWSFYQAASQHIRFHAVV